MFIFSTFALAEDYHEEGPEIGNPTYDTFLEKVPDFERITHVPGVTFTTIGGALCSDFPDWTSNPDSIGTQVNADRICWNNRDGGSPRGSGVEHQGVAYQIFHTTSEGRGGWTALHPVRANGGHGFLIPGGQNKCVNIERGQYYFRQAFYCDDFSNSCSNYEPVCRTNTGTEMKRLCTQTGTETVISPKIHTEVPFCDGFEPPPNRDDEANAGDDGSDDSVDDSDLNGEWSAIAMPNNVQPGDLVTGTAIFKATKRGEYYLEAGMESEPAKAFAVITETSASECDGDIHWAGKTVPLAKGEQATMTFKFFAREKPGIYPIVIGAYSGCTNFDGEHPEFTGKEVEKDQVFIKVGTASDDDDDDGGSNLPFSLTTIIMILGGLAIAFVVLNKKGRR
tara:strand:- start:826 stop:2007 length:1182 start_codon:yes stop_codon:yes gene_type:complete